MSWTKKHDEFCLEQKLRPSTRLLLRWLLRRAKLNEITELEIDLKKFNTWVAKKRGREFDRKTIREAIAQLDEETKGMICIYKSYTPWVKKLIVRPLSFVVEKKPPTMGNTPKQTTEKPMFDADRKNRVDLQQQQDISRIDSLFNEIGLKYDRDALNRIWRLANKSIDNVVSSIELLLYRHSTKAIAKPHGFIMDCLKFGWQKGIDLFYEPELPRFNSKAELEQFSNALREKNKAKYGGDSIYERLANRRRMKYQT